MLALNLGFTGTSGTITDDQLLAVITYIENANISYCLHHGDCIGADTAMDEIGNSDNNCETVTIHPPSDPKKRAFCNSSKTVILKEKDYLTRNHDIVDIADILFALPASMKEELRSGTWATVRYARKQSKPIIIFWPNGTITKELS